MFTKFQKIIQTGIVTSPYPYKKERIPERFRGRIELDEAKCNRCGSCIDICPTGAYTSVTGYEGRSLQLSHARCIFCGICKDVCPSGAITITHDFELAATNKNSLTIKIGGGSPQEESMFTYQAAPKTTGYYLWISSCIGKL